jgi:hypothetical protein
LRFSASDLIERGFIAQGVDAIILAPVVERFHVERQWHE